MLQQQACVRVRVCLYPLSQLPTRTIKFHLIFYRLFVGLISFDNANVATLNLNLGNSALFPIVHKMCGFFFF